MTEPTTKAGKALLADLTMGYEPTPGDVIMPAVLAGLAQDIAAAETEAREGYVPASLSPEWKAELTMAEADGVAAERARLREAVEALPGDSVCYCEADRDVTHDELDGGSVIYVRRAAILALMEPDA